MLIKLVESSVRNPLWVSIFILLTIVVGVRSALQLPIDAVPDITGVQVMVYTKTGAMDPEQVETTVTYPLESELSGIQNVEEIRSLTKYGLSQINIIFEESMDLYFARQLVAERLQGAISSIPEGLKPSMGAATTGLGEVVMYTVKAKEGSELASRPRDERLRYLRTVQDWQIARELRTVPGVAEVDSNGGFSRAIYIHFNPGRLYAEGIGPVGLAETLSSVGTNEGGGYIEQNNRRLIVRSDSRFRSVSQIRSFPVRIHSIGGSVQLGELAQVEEGNLPRVGAATDNGEEAVLGTVLMRNGANSREVAVKSLEKIRSLGLPPDVEIDVLYSRSYLVNETVKTVATNLAEGGFLVILVLLLIAGNLRAAILVSTAIPLSMLFALTGMDQLGISANLLSLGAIDFGLIVDGSVVVIENILRKMEEDPERVVSEGRRPVIIEAVKEVAGPVTAGLSIIMIVYVPILLLTGIEGKMFRPMAVTVLLALAASLAIAFLVMPSIAALVIKIPKEHKSPLFAKIRSAYEPVLELTLTKTKYFLAGTLAFSAICFILFFTLPSEFVPNLDEGDLVIGVTRNADISLPEAQRQQSILENEILKFKEVQHIFSRTGTPESATDPMGIHLTDTFVILNKNYDEWPETENGRRRTKSELFEAIAEMAAQIQPESELSPTQPIEMRFNEMLEGSRADLSLRIFGPDLSVLLKNIDGAKEIISEMEGVDEVAEDALTALRSSPVLDFQPIPGQMAYWGVSGAVVTDAFHAAMAGQEISYLYEQDRRFPVILRMNQDARNSSESVQKLPVDLPEGGVVAFQDIAKLTVTDQVTTIARYNSKRYSGLAIYLKPEANVLSFVEEANRKVTEGLDLGSNYHLEWAGQYKNLQRARARFAVILPLTLFLIFLILYSSLRNLRQSFLVLLCIPLAVTGGILLLWIRSIPFSVSASVGMIALSGIAILNGTVLVNFFNQLRQDGYTIAEAVREGTLIRLRPVLMTALVAGLGFVPMALNTGTGAEVQRPLATVVVGGLITSTILTLLILPSLYEKTERFFMSKKNGSTP